MRRIMLALAGTLCWTSHCAALDMTAALETADKLLYVNLSGPIVLGDDQKFRNLVLPYIKAGNVLFKVNIFSPGGSVDAAIGIGRQINVLKAITAAPILFNGLIDRGLVPGTTVQCWHWVQAGDAVMNNAPGAIHIRDAYGHGDRSCDCESACFLIWISGLVREGNYVGIHRIRYNEIAFAKLTAAEAEQAYAKSQDLTLGYLNNLKVPESISQLMFAVRSTSMHFLTSNELQLLKSTPYLEELTQARCGSSRERTYHQDNERITEYDNAHVTCYRSVLKEVMLAGAKQYLLPAMGD